jgi:hypothetical protein
MVIFQKNHVIQAKSVIVSATGHDRRFLQRSQARRRLARIEDAGFAPPNRVNKAARNGGDARKTLQKIQGDTLCSQDRAQRAAHLEHGLISLYDLSRAANDLHPETRVDTAKDVGGHFRTGDDSTLPGKDARIALLASNKMAGGDVSGPNILSQRHVDWIAGTGGRASPLEPTSHRSFEQSHFSRGSCLADWTLASAAGLRRF